MSLRIEPARISTLLLFVTFAAAFAGKPPDPCQNFTVTSAISITINTTGGYAVANPRTACVPPLIGVTFKVSNGKNFTADFDGSSLFLRLTRFDKDHATDLLIVDDCDYSSSNYRSDLHGCLFSYKATHIDSQGNITQDDPHIIVQPGGGGDTNRILRECKRMLELGFSKRK